MGVGQSLQVGFWAGRLGTGAATVHAIFALPDIQRCRKIGSRGWPLEPPTGLDAMTVMTKPIAIGNAIATLRRKPPLLSNRTETARRGGGKRASSICFLKNPRAGGRGVRAGMKTDNQNWLAFNVGCDDPCQPDAVSIISDAEAKTNSFCGKTDLFARDSFFWLRLDRDSGTFYVVFASDLATAVTPEAE